MRYWSYTLGTVYPITIKYSRLKRYRIDDDAMIYGTYSKGYRSGGVNGRVDELASATTPYDPETVDSYELGFKSEWMDQRLRLNGALFYMEYEDKQEEIC